MTSKDQERRALAQIKRILEEIGPESYIGRAFDGCVEMAEGNIKNDTWFSMKEGAESAGDFNRSKMAQLKQELEATKRELKIANFTAIQATERADKATQELERLKGRIRVLIR